MKRNILIVISLSMFFVGCQIPKVPDYAKVSTYKKSRSNSIKSDKRQIKTLSINERIACEYNYCIANSILETDPNCKPANKAYKSELKKYKKDFDMSRKIKAIQNFTRQCPHTDIITYPF